MSNTKVRTIHRRYSLDEIGTVGSPLKLFTCYPMMHERDGNEYFHVLHSVHVDDGVLQVIGDADNGWYEWVWFTAPTAPAHCDIKTGDIHHTSAGFGMASYCLHDGLTFAFGKQGWHKKPAHTEVTK